MTAPAGEAAVESAAQAVDSARAVEQFEDAESAEARQRLERLVHANEALIEQVVCLEELPSSWRALLLSFKRPSC